MLRFGLEAGRVTLLERLRAVDTGAVSDALDRLGLRGVAPGLHRLTGTRIEGVAATVRLAPADGRTSATHLASRTLDRLRPGEVLVVANDGRIEAGAWGGLLTRAAKSRGAAGVVVDGAVRDLDELEALGVTVFARATTPASARGRFIELEADGQVQVAGVDVTPGDLVLGDGAGLVFVPRERAAEVLDAAEDIATREAVLARALDDGARASQVLDGAYERMSRRPERKDD